MNRWQVFSKRFFTYKLFKCLLFDTYVYWNYSLNLIIQLDFLKKWQRFVNISFFVSFWKALYFNTHIILMRVSYKLYWLKFSKVWQPILYILFILKLFLTSFFEYPHCISFNFKHFFYNFETGGHLFSFFFFVFLLKTSTYYFLNFQCSIILQYIIYIIHINKGGLNKNTLSSPLSLSL